MTSHQTKTLIAQCHCKAVHFTVDIPVADLPLKTYLCHCSVCRTAHGTLNIHHTHLPRGVSPKWVAPSGPHVMISYKAVPNSAGSSHFCGTCGSQIFCTEPFESNGGDETEMKYTISTPIFDDHGSDVFATRSHIYTKSAPGSGLYDLLPSINGQKLEVPDLATDKPTLKTEIEHGADGEERLRAQCHCGGVSFTFPRPTDEVRADEFQSKALSPTNPNKWKGVFCFCDDCRLTQSTIVTPHMFVSRKLISPAVGPDLQLGTNKVYESSPGILRSFCRVCGASVFNAYPRWKPDDENKQILNVMVGLVRAPEGVLAQDWIHWRWVGWPADGMKYDPDFTSGFREGVKKWSLENQGEDAIGELPEIQ
jgi:hypothetical protein